MRRAYCARAIALLLAGMSASPRAEEPASRPFPAVGRAVLEPFKGDWDEMRQRRRLRVLVVYSRMLYYVDRGKQRGVNYAFFKAFEDEVNAGLKNPRVRFHVVFVPVSRDALIPSLLEGRGDLAAANLTVTPQRAELVDFAASILDEVGEVVVTGPATPAISSVEALSGQPVHVRKSSSYWEHLEALNQRLVQQGRPPVRLVPVPEELENEDILEMVNAGLLPITVCDGHQALFWKQVYGNLSFDPTVVVSSGGSIAWMMRKNSPQLKAVVNAFVRTHRKGTAFGNELFQSYFKTPSSVLAATSGAELRKFRQTLELFRKYGTRYELDHLLVMAQGYQESRLDQNVRSPAGALGVMQLMPATGAQMSVGDIRQLEPNIHAGVKYLRHVEDTYFAEPSLDPVVKALFAFASYNAGPSRVLSLRKEAARRGLDPDRWFRNVEYVAAEKIGRETVTYVSNIFKYYVAYQMVAQAERDRAAAREALEAAMTP
ncbi:MAG TPA: lytic transglycosylase F [Myxococcaceae bacterium]|nr:lytic transglycosylase F [Myxococcaceae bacterium]